MKIGKILNSNVVISKNEFGEEVVCMGKGLAFRGKIGDEISSEAVQKEFVLRDSFTKNQFRQLMADIPAKEIEWVKQIVELAEDKLKVEFSPNIYLTLTDHLHYAITRVKENIRLPNPLLLEAKEFYPKEYQAVKEVLLFVKQKADMELSEGEAGFVTFHFMNSQQRNEDMRVTITIAIMVRDILSVISKFFDIVFNEESLDYQCIITHLQFFAQCYLEGEGSDGQGEFLYALVQEKYPKAFRCAERISGYLRQTQKQEIGVAEQIYLTVHIQRVVSEKKSI